MGLAPRLTLLVMCSVEPTNPSAHAALSGFEAWAVYLAQQERIWISIG